MKIELKGLASRQLEWKRRKESKKKNEGVLLCWSTKGIRKRGFWFFFPFFFGGPAESFGKRKDEERRRAIRSVVCFSQKYRKKGVPRGSEAN